MSNELSTDRVINFRKSLNTVFNSKSGKEVIKFLQESYVDVPVVDSTPELTYYRLGQKEFVQGLIKDATTSIAEIDDLGTSNIENLGG